MGVKRIIYPACWINIHHRQRTTLSNAALALMTQTAPCRPSASIIGASGYSGAELTRLLLRHPAVSLHHLYAHSQAGKRTSELYPALGCDLAYERYLGECDSDLYFLALPHGEALSIVPGLLAAGKRVIDLSGDFRIRDVAEHLRFYKQEKSSDAVLTYGMPELDRDGVCRATAISNPGCYATSIVLGLAPLFHALDKPEVLRVACTAMSGISGAGRTGKLELSFPEMSGNIRAYKVGQHQHTPEIMQALGTTATDPSFSFTFTPLIGPLVRGIYTTLTISLREPIEASAAEALYGSFYADAPFVRLREAMPEVAHVAHTNFCDLHVAHASPDGTLVVVSCIDNLMKGAAGQAIQNMNLMLGLDEGTGLLPS